ncbi:MAG: Fic family protein [Deltaproteobacteria bacterium]|nr:Fic family protein [Deltaproteobacteria bacterium]
MADFDEKFEVSWIFHENALEGAVLDIFDLKAALDHATVGDGILIPTYQRIRNHKNAIEKTRKFATDSKRMPTLAFIKALHIALSHGLQGQTGGTYRKDIPIHRTYFHEILDPGKISYAMNKMVRGFKGKEFKQLHPIHQAAEVHFRFMRIFPFDIDNGKVARLLMNLFTIRAGYYPIILPDVERQHYYEALRTSAGDLRNLIVGCMERQLDQALRTLYEG